MPLLSVDEALQHLLAAIHVLGSETIALENSLGRALSEPIEALLTQPPFDSSAMDGYACRAEDVNTIPCRLKIVGESAAGHSFSGHINKGQAIRIFTGAPVPGDADSVIIQENTTRVDSGTVEFLQPLIKGQNIRPAGGDFKKGETVLEQGHVMTPASLALAAAAGHATINVVRAPRVGVLSTGDELVPAGTRPGPDQIIASNAYGLSAVLRACRAEVIDLGIAADNKEAIKAAIAKAREQKVDLILSSGGVSVGDYDLVQTVLQEEGMVLDFWKIAMRPGKPLMFGKLPDATLVIGLPGNPASSLTTCQLFVIPVLEKLSGRPYKPDIRRAKLNGTLKANGDRRHYIRAVLKENNDGTYSVTPATSHDSSLLKIMAHSNCLIVHNENAKELNKGDECKVFIPNGGL